MKTFKKTVNTVLIVTGLLVGNVALAEDAEQPTNQTQSETEKSINSMTEQLVNDLQQQLGISVKQQVNTTLNALAESIKQLVK